MTPEILQTVIIALIGSGLFQAVSTVVSKRSKSPESQNELARLGNEFASKLLEDARVERKELKDTIVQLESIKSSQANELETKNNAINKLQQILHEKELKITDLENRQQEVARKLQVGEKITLSDIFGRDAPQGIHVIVDSKDAVA